MQPIDYRNATFSELNERIAGLRRDALRAWQAHGPGTTEEVAERSGMSLLTLRPRTTELYQLGYVVLIGGGRRGGTYRAATPVEVREHFHSRKLQAQAGAQLQLF